MELEKIEKIEKSINTLRNKESKIYFLVQDTKGNAKGSIRFTYQIADTLKKSGFNPIIIHEKDDYIKPEEWLGEDISSLPHQSIESQNLNVSPEDFVVIPEIYGHVMEQISNLSCGKIVLAQAYDHMLETLQPGIMWSQYNFIKVITTSEKQKEYIEQVMKNSSFDIIEPFIPEVFSEKQLPSKPIVSIHTRDQRDTMKIIKTFYLKYPQYRWITFRDMRGLNQSEFSEYLKDSFVSVWVDDTSAFGTFPIESMSCGTPVIGKVPNMKPEWMKEENGIWTYEQNIIPDILSEYIQNWLEDNINIDLYDESLKTSENFKDYDKFKNSVVELFGGYLDERALSFESQIEKIKVTEE